MNKEYDEAIEFTKKHYENFPVVSFFVPRELRKHIAVIYKFARAADDIADEGNLSADERLEKLRETEVNLIKALEGVYVSPYWRALHNTIVTYSLTTENLFLLLKAFKFDVENPGFENFDRILNYCKMSANPVGRIVLEFYDIRDEEAFFFSDKICTALQLANFYQDVSRDVKKGRIYFPDNELVSFGVTKEQLINLNFTENARKLIRFSCERAMSFFDEGKELLGFVEFPLKQQIALVLAGGKLILKKMEELNYNTLESRPEITKTDFFFLAKSFFESLKRFPRQ